ncbi:hypothetical protein KsCSTR_40430 [Candidatus Kuenenia stuttgartiensis]|uniref:GTP-binding protein n=1 Tax=Kuenenia stuttgartiensis TaxID=174633 RepID=Q1Q7M9_KUEST|nr:MULTISPECIES: DUF4416 family protein [Kuenenia]MBE7548077.1 DUF4416 family protein [Planctomycetia bacterium]MBW7942793.1 DUF4416 family protein [Candidatus Kuenenia stuttgartiensis]MBZ0190377.1 DUF4416 family protein [Candidatus Kuenenia stuttgartiensis]MCF6153171.1 DUF4416 family protein [Candidatus Kuenenia stuttgartiensis]MCL4728209.1 DUF4416 family protein [Candidatus Kuenenia stuttgartiensis]
MGEIGRPKPANLIIGVLSGVQVLFAQIGETLEGYFGEIDLRSNIQPFHYTRYYNDEMGEGILRQFFSFERLIMPDEIAAIKIKTNALEEAIASEEKYVVARPVNIDPGYINESRLILASTKDFSHRIYLRDGIYAEVTLDYRQGKYESFPWTFPDYKSSEYQEFFLLVRGHYVKKLKGMKG